MYEQLTYEAIMEEMLSRVTSDVDKREGSVIYDALAPAAYHLAQNYFYLEGFRDLVFGDEAIDSYLDRVVADYGLTRKPAVQAVRKISTSGAVDIGTRWGINDISYTITELISTNEYKAVCAQYGDIGNVYAGTLENIDNISGVTAILTDIIIPGMDRESDGNLRVRYFEKVRLPATSGNANQYKQWALEVTGVGGAKVFPLWNGPGSVKVVIVDNYKQPVTLGLIQETAEHIESVRPIGAAVTVVSGSAKLINLSAKLTLAPGYSLQTVTSSLKEVMSSYFQSIAFSQTYVSYAKTVTLLLGTEGVVDFENLKLNGAATNITLADEEIPSIGNISLEV